MTGMRLWTFLAAGYLSYVAARLRGHVFGISSVVRYLRNPHPAATVRLLRAFGAQVGERAVFKRSLFLDNVWEDRESTGDLRHLQIGRNCYIGDGVFLDLANRIHVEDNAVIAARAAILTHSDCNRSEFLDRCFPRSSGPVRIGQGAWIGFGAVLAAGCRIGGESVVAAGSVLRSDTPPRSVYAGVPARKIRDLETGDAGTTTATDVVGPL